MQMQGFELVLTYGDTTSDIFACHMNASLRLETLVDALYPPEFRTPWGHTHVKPCTKVPDLEHIVLQCALFCRVEVKIFDHKSKHLKLDFPDAIEHLESTTYILKRSGSTIYQISSPT